MKRSTSFEIGDSSMSKRRNVDLEGITFERNVMNNSTVQVGHFYASDREQDVAARLKKQLLESLTYPEMQWRKNQISDAQFETFEWLLTSTPEVGISSSPPPTSQDWNDYGRETREAVTERFQNWLQHKAGLFFIQGKAGSGKSTLMKFILNHSNTRQLLEHWSDGVDVSLLFHAFWLLGSPLQHSLKGLLASLLFQLFHAQPDAILSCVKEPILKRSLGDWTVNELRGVFVGCIKKFSLPIMAFVDGIDELARSDQDGLFSLFDELSRFPNFKICASTRPIHSILKYVRLWPDLKVQDVTALDIENYVTQKLKAKIRIWDGPDNKEDILKELVRNMCFKAEGVFLWVHYVLENVCQGISNDDNLEYLSKRIDLLPNDMLELYMQMWHSQNLDNQIYREKSRALFACASYFPLNPYKLFLMLNPAVRKSYLKDFAPHDEDAIQNRVHAIRTEMRTLSAGLIECVSLKAPEKYHIHDGNFHTLGYCDPYVTGSKHDKLLRSTSPTSWRALRVQFIHKTVYDFLVDTEEGRQILGASHSEEESINHMFLEAVIGMVIEDDHMLGYLELTDLASFLISFSEDTLLEAYDMLDGALCVIASQRTKVKFEDFGLSGNRWFQHMLWWSGRHWIRSDAVLDFNIYIIRFAARFFPLLQKLIAREANRWSAYYKGFVLCSALERLFLDMINAGDFADALMMVEQLFANDFDCSIKYEAFVHDCVVSRPPIQYLIAKIFYFSASTGDKSNLKEVFEKLSPYVDDNELKDLGISVFGRLKKDIRRVTWSEEEFLYDECISDSIIIMHLKATELWRTFIAAFRHVSHENTIQDLRTFLWDRINNNMSKSFYFRRRDRLTETIQHAPCSEKLANIWITNVDTGSEERANASLFEEPFSSLKWTSANPNLQDIDPDIIFTRGGGAIPLPFDYTKDISELNRKEFGPFRYVYAEVHAARAVSDSVAQLPVVIDPNELYRKTRSKILSISLEPEDVNPK